MTAALVLGTSALDTRTMQGIAKSYGFRKGDFYFEVDYDKIVSFTGRCNKLEKYSAVILGACPHKVQAFREGAEAAGIITANGDENKSETKMNEIREFAKSI